ncbi:hypothetical protein [Orgyia pseudotsugata single capsid nuclopolyhedrovirus]|nr:hypothetical protein [Orgyia pseudotsugata single capsid nuclopolyhedrovirus]
MRRLSAMIKPSTLCYYCSTPLNLRLVIAQYFIIIIIMIDESYVCV